MRALNSSISVATGKSPDELIFGSKPFEMIPGPLYNDPDERIIDRLDASDSMSYTDDHEGSL
jgi:hypothetical protein